MQSHLSSTEDSLLAYQLKHLKIKYQQCAKTTAVLLDNPVIKDGANALSVVLGVTFWLDTSRLNILKDYKMVYFDQASQIH